MVHSKNELRCFVQNMKDVLRRSSIWIGVKDAAWLQEGFPPRPGSVRLIEPAVGIVRLHGIAVLGTDAVCACTTSSLTVWSLWHERVADLSSWIITPYGTLFYLSLLYQ